MFIRNFGNELVIDILKNAEFHLKGVKDLAADPVGIRWPEHRDRRGVRHAGSLALRGGAVRERRCWGPAEKWPELTEDAVPKLC